MVLFTTISNAVAPAGMICCGGFTPLPEDGIDGSARTVILIGSVGPAMWRAFAASVPETARNEALNPLDTWTREVLTKAARHLGARALFPFEGPPFHPFMRWAQRAEAIAQSPIGPLIHPRHGLWQAYRAALVFNEAIEVPAPERAPIPCARCPEKPCTTGCPVDAIRRDAYDTRRCIDHVLSESGADCRALGCRARRMCPVGVAFGHQPEQAAFHMGKLIAAHSRCP
jgi:ferredoxin